MNAALQKATQAKTDFIGTVSHELRNPLAGARMMSEVLKNSALDPWAKDQADKLHGCVGEQNKISSQPANRPERHCQRRVCFPR